MLSGYNVLWMRLQERRNLASNHTFYIMNGLILMNGVLHESTLMKRLDEWRLVTLIGMIFIAIGGMMYSIARLFKSWISEDEEPE